MKEINNIKLVERWLDNPDGNFTLLELYTLLYSIQDPDLKIFLESYLNSKWRESGLMHEEIGVDLDNLYLKISRQIEKYNIDRQSANRNVLNRPIFKKTMAWFSRIAAVLFIPLLILLLEEYKHDNNKKTELISSILSNTEYFSPPGTRTRIILPDSSEVWLNANSRLKLYSDFGNSSRDVELIGEAFFSVKNNREKPFSVSLNDMKIRVTGTTFNVSAYPDQEKIETVLLAGEIYLKYKSEDKDKEFVMKPSQKVLYDKKSGEIEQSAIETTAYDSWKDGKLIFRNHSLKDVITILERWFNVKISVDDQELYQYNFTATLDNRSLDQILMFLSFSSPINYFSENNVIHLLKRNKPMWK